MFVQHWKWRQAKKSREVWFISLWLRVLRRAIKSKRTGMLSDGIILLYDNALPHTDDLVRDKLQRFDWETHQQSPYIPDLSPCAFHMFGELKKDIRGRRFHSDEEVQGWVNLWIHQRPTSFYKSGIYRLVSQWDKCINTCGKLAALAQMVACLPLVQQLRGSIPGGGSKF